MKLTKHNLGLLASLNTILEEESVTHAAVKLGISQPALSAQLATLRQIFSDPLLVPATPGKSMVLTARGHSLRDPLRHALRNLEDVVNNAQDFDPVAAEKVFTIGANDNAGAIIAPNLLHRVRAAGIANVRFAFRAIDFKTLPQQLETGEIDVALVSKVMTPNLSQAPLLKETFRMAQRKDHPRGHAPTTLLEYAELEHIIVSGDGGGFRGFIDERLSALGVTRRVGVSVQFYSLVPLLLQASDLVCTLPAQFLDRYADSLLSTPLPFDAKQFALYSTWHPRFEADTGHRWLRRQLVACTA